MKMGNMSRTRKKVDNNRRQPIDLQRIKTFSHLKWPLQKMCSNSMKMADILNSEQYKIN